MASLPENAAAKSMNTPTPITSGTECAASFPPLPAQIFSAGLPIFTAAAKNDAVERLASPFHLSFFA
ncbi:hypothetical protein RND71_006246 [Anisodus tanguticus]|uniref:Uncharacterized protein n=1 Tax=Anisodus tanguticus TaxID=243964 RepID=A0AAE1SRK9_9SOLA|nr:hypothetical protein RND71_006246 [Anisodus tanguticus]